MGNCLIFIICLFLGSCNLQKAPDPKKIGKDSQGSLPSPIVNSISPSSYGVRGGANVTITGEGFDSGATVAIGGAACINVVVTGTSQIDCTLTYHFASVTDVVVSNSNGVSGTLVSGFAYNSFLYASNQSGSPALRRMKIDSANGSITDLGTTTAPNGAYGVEIDASNQWVYTAATSANQIGGFVINHSNGDLTPIAGSPFTAGSGVNGLAISKDSKCLIASNFSGAVGAKVTSYSINASSGSLTKVADYAGGNNPGGIAIDPLNRFVYVANYASHNVSAYSLNTTNCMLTFIANYASGNSPDGITVHSSGSYVYTGNANSTGGVTAFSVNTSTGALTQIAIYPTSNSTNGSGVEIDKTGGQLYATARGGGTAGTGKVWGYNINPANGTLSNISQWPTNDGPNDVRILGNGKYLFTANTESNTISVFIRDLSTGGLTAATPAFYTIGNSPGIIGITF